MTLPHEYEISFLTEVIPEPGDTVEGILNYVRDIATDRQSRLWEQGAAPHHLP